MPSYIPRNEPTRKKEQLLNCSEYLRLAIFHNKSQEQIEKRAEKFRVANISLIKARLHSMKQIEYQSSEPNLHVVKLEALLKNWELKHVSQIIEEFNGI